jgi:hypothetical protein
MIQNILPHPYAELFSMEGGESLEELAADIAANGLVNAIVLDEGLILDGRRRYAACKLAEVEGRFENFSYLVAQGRAKPNGQLAFVVSQNLHRRHLSDAQRAEVAAKLANMPRGNPALTSSNTANRVFGLTEAKAAEMMNVSVDQVQRAKRKQRETESGDNKEPEEAEPKPERSEQLRKIVSALQNVRSLVVAFNGDATPDDVDELEKAVNGLRVAVNKLCAPDKSEPLSDDSVMTFGKHKGERLSQIDTGYYRWWLNKNPDRDEIESAAVVARYPEKAVLNQKLKFHVYATERVEREQSK